MWNPYQKRTRLCGGRSWGVSESGVPLCCSWVLLSHTPAAYSPLNSFLPRSRHKYLEVLPQNSGMAENHLGSCLCRKVGTRSTPARPQDAYTGSTAFPAFCLPSLMFSTSRFL